jgi:hypothetical protein
VGKKSIAFFIIFVTVSAGLAGENQQTALCVSAGGGVVLSREDPFQLKAQADFGGGIGVEFPAGRLLAVGLGLGGHQTLPSSLAGGWAYRGFGGFDLRALLILKGLPPLALGRLRAEPNLAAGPVVRYDRYQYTRLYFFYLGLVAAPGLEIPLPRSPHHALTVSLPLRLYFRRDIDLSAACGLELGWKFYPGLRSGAR